MAQADKATIAIQPLQPHRIPRGRLLGHVRKRFKGSHLPQPTQWRQPQNGPRLNWLRRRSGTRAKAGVNKCIVVQPQQCIDSLVHERSLPIQQCLQRQVLLAVCLGQSCLEKSSPGPHANARTPCLSTGCRVFCMEAPLQEISASKAIVGDAKGSVQRDATCLSLHYLVPLTPFV